eukprot:5364732-Ditylum_brightwellii.AAC.1
MKRVMERVMKRVSIKAARVLCVRWTWRESAPSQVFPSFTMMQNRIQWWWIENWKVLKETLILARNHQSIDDVISQVPSLGHLMQKILSSCRIVSSPMIKSRMEWQGRNAY